MSEEERKVQWLKIWLAIVAITAGVIYLTKILYNVQLIVSLLSK